MYREKLNLPEVYNSRKDERGVALIEAAIIVPVVVVLLLGVIQYGYLLAGYISLRSASAVTARYVAIINPGIPNNSPNIRNVAVGALSPSFDPTLLEDPVVTDETVGGVGGAKRVSLTYNMPLFFPIVVPQSQNGVFALQAEIVMR